MNITCVGGCGFVGSILVPKLLKIGHNVTVYDSMLFGNYLPWSPRLRVLHGDIRDTHKLSFELHGMDTIIHLACISNDPSAELDPELTKAVNYTCFELLIHAAKSVGVKRFIFASSSSVYGVSDAPEVTETHPLNPLTDYSRYKQLCEEIVREYQSPTFETVIVRPATVCGYSPRMRFDVIVNILTNLAVNHGKITLFSPTLKRPSIHIEDLCDLYCQLVHDNRAAGHTFNAGRENHTIAELAGIVQAVVQAEFGKPVHLETAANADNRSYHISSLKAAQVLGFHPYRSVADAVWDICQAFKRGQWEDSFADQFFNVKVLKAASESAVAPLLPIPSCPSLH